MSDPRPDEFQRFHDLLTEHAPDGYTPWYFRCRAASKAPDTNYGSWKEEGARLSVEEALEWMEQGGNVGIAGTDEDELVNVDIDDEDETTPSDLKDTLIARSRSRTGVHAWYFAAPGEDIPNIPTDDAGEVRTNWQYVVAPGSYVEMDPDEVPDDEAEDAGYYTVEWKNEVTSLRFDELPEVFRDHHRQTEQEDTEPELSDDLPDGPVTGDDDGRKSALFDVTAGDVVRKERGSTDTDDRWSSLFHGSKTSANMSLSDKGRIQCWRHNVAHGGLQALAVLSEYSGTCKDVGTGHKSSNAASSCFDQEDGAHVWHAWKYAKRNGYIPDDDPVPYSAIRHLCKARDLCAVTEIPDSPEDGSIPGHAYDAALKTIESADGLAPGRKPTTEIEDSGDRTRLERRDDQDAAATSPDDAPEPGQTTDWSDVRDLYQLANDVREQPKGPARQAAEEQLLNETSFMCVTESDKLWVYDGDSGTYNEHGEPYIGSTLKEELGPFYAVSEKNEIIDRVKEGNRVLRHEVNAKQDDRSLVCVGNGVVDLDTGDLLDHDPEYRFIRGLDVDFPTPENGLDADRDTILEFLDDVTKRTADRDTLLDHLGHGLMPGHPYRAFLVAFGPGGNGKTQVARLFTGFVGEDNAANVEIDELVNDDFATSDLPGKFLNWGDDMSGDGGGTLEELSTLKKASGGSYLRANEKYEKTFNFKNEAALFFSANEPPRLGEVKPSVKDRLYPIDMPYRFVSDPNPDEPMEKQKVQNYAQTLLDDDAAMRGLLELAVEHARRLRDDRGEYSMPEDPDERFEIYNQEADPIVRFTRTVVEPAAPDVKIRKDDVYRVYQSVMDAWQERGAGERGFKRQFPRTVTEDVEDARSRVLATDDDEKDRVPCWKRVTWTEDALEHMPEWMRDRYSGHFEKMDTEDETTDESGADNLPLSPAEVSTDWMSDNGRLPAIEATVTGKHMDRFNNPAGHLRGETDGIDYTAVSTGSPELPSGAVVRVLNAKLSKNELGALEIEIDPTAEVVIVEAPKTDDSSTDAETATDGGESDDGEASSEQSNPDGDEYEQAKPKVLSAVREAVEANGNQPADHSDVLDQIGDALPEDRVRECIESLVEIGRIQRMNGGVIPT